MSGAHANPDRIDYCPFSGASIGRHDVPLDPAVMFAITIGRDVTGVWPSSHRFCHIMEHYKSAYRPQPRARRRAHAR